MTEPITPGEPYPLGATFDGYGTNFALFSEVAQSVELCLFEDDGVGETRVPLPEVDGYVWHGYLPGVGPGTRYGFRAHGPWDPAQGLWTNPAKLLNDPYARAFTGGVVDHPALVAFDPDRPDRPDPRDSAPYTMRSLVVSEAFDWGEDRPPRIPYAETVIAEAHVKGLTKANRAVRRRARGTYLGVADPALIDHYRRIGITAVELLPVHQHVTEPVVARRGLVNYWGYSTFGFFAPHAGYAASPVPGSAVSEFKEMVRRLHEAKIEVILDVVFNHTAEGPHDGPTYSYRGLDNPSYYRLEPADRRRYRDTTGVGNSLNVNHWAPLRLIMDSLRYWVTEMHVDGFRFDLASSLAREGAHVDRLAAFFDLVAQDPVLNRMKLIAEPWDVAPGGYQVGNFPPRWSEWNGAYRDTVRDFWRGVPGLAGPLATRLAGSSDLYADDGRHPVASVNFVTAHDGFTLHDLVSYSRKHNEANREDNRDGTDDNRSSGYGAEGPTSDVRILAVRARQQRNLLATLLLSQGVPMLLAGDERDRTQQGNNNAFCHDSELTWVDWNETTLSADLEELVARLTRLRSDNPVFRRRRFLTGRPLPDDGGAGPYPGLPDVVWVRPDGADLEAGDWAAAFARSIGFFLNGGALPWLDRRGSPVRGDSFLLYLNADEADLVVRPPARLGRTWRVEVDTTFPRGESDAVVTSGEPLTVMSRSVLVMRRLA